MPDALELTLRRLERKLDGVSLEVPAVDALAAALSIKRPVARSQRTPAPSPAAPARGSPKEAPAPELVEPRPLPTPLAPPSVPEPVLSSSSGDERPGVGQTLNFRISPKRRAFASASLVVLVLTGTWMGLRSRHLPAGVHGEFPLPLSQSAGLTLKGTVAYSADPRRLLLYAIDARAGRVLSIRKFPNPNVSGLAWGEGCLWSADADSGSIYQHELDDSFSVRRVFANPERKPQALYWDGKSLWVADAATETVYRYGTGESLIAMQQFALPGVFTAGIHVDGDILWVLDGWTRKVYRYRLKPIPVLLDVLATDDWLPAGSRVSGMAVQGSTLWIAAGSPEALHRFDWKRLPVQKAPQGVGEEEGSQSSSGSRKQ